MATLSRVTKSVAKYILPWAPFPNTSRSSYRSQSILGTFLIMSMNSVFELTSLLGFDVPAVSWVAPAWTSPMIGLIP